MKKTRIVLLIVSNNDYQAQQAIAAKQSAQELDAELDIIPTEHDSISQSQKVFEILYLPPEKRPDAILFEPVGTPLAKAAELAASSGVGWVVLNREVDYLSDFRHRCSAPMFSVTTDHNKVGRIQGEQIAALLPNGGSVFYIQGPSDNKAAVTRAAAMQAAKPTNVEVRALRGLWTDESAFSAVKSWLQLNVTKHAHYAVVAAQNDAMALGARRAFQENTSGPERDHWLSLPFLGCDGLPGSGQLYVSRKILTATIVIPANAGQAVKTMVTSLRSGQRPAECIFVDAHSYPDLAQLKAQTG